ncbi:MAG: AI-2E family transporter [Sediminispirochaetaceae bacterium]
MKYSGVAVGLLGVIAVIMLGAVLKLASSILLPLIIAVFLSFIVAPVVNFLDRSRIPRIIAILVVILIFFGVIFLIFLFLQTSVNSLIREYPKYATRFTELNMKITEMISERFDVQVDVFDQINWQGALRGYLVELSGSFMQFATSFVIILIFLIFLLMEKPFFKYKLARAFGDETGKHIGRIIEHINRQIGRYINLKFFVSLATGFFVWFFLQFIGVDFALVWGVLAFLLNFIPSVGSTIVLIITITMGVVQFYPDMGKIVAVFVSMTGTQVLIGNILDPKLQGRRLDLSAFLILFSLIFWGWIWGPVGMFLAVPITAIIQIVCYNIAALRPLAVLMSGGQVLKVESPPEPPDEIPSPEVKWESSE